MSNTVDKTSLIEKSVELYSNDLYRQAYFKTSNKEAAQNIVQETFLAAFNGIDNFKGDSNIRTWLFSILNFKVADYFRKKYKNNELSIGDDAVSEQLFDKNGAWGENSSITAWEEEPILLDRPEFNDALSACLDHLPEKSRVAVRFKYINNKKGEEICKELGISPTNYWQLLHRAKLQIRKYLDGTYKTH
jgi:RNA polymerase sigma-70 factor (ECF subfamily)